MVLAYDMKRQLVFANPAVETMTGYSTAELERANFICWIHPEDQARMLSLWDGLFQGQRVHEEYRLVTKDGRVKWMAASWSPLIDDSGRQVGVQGREFDITTRKLAESALRHSEEKLRFDEERYRELFESSPFPMWEEDFSELKRYLDSLAASGVTDLRTYLREHRRAVEECLRRVRVLDVNRAAREFYRASSKEELLKGLSKIFDEAAFEVFREEIATLAENHRSFQTEFSVRTLEGEERLVDMIVSIVDSAQPDWSRVIVSFFDITDRKRLEEQFVQSQKMESLGRLAGGIAHDFNNLLTVINGYSEWMLSEMDVDHPYRQRIAAVHEAGQQCAELTKQLLTFSRKHIAQPGPLDLNHLIRDSQSVLNRLLGDDIQICTRLAQDLGTIKADRGQMHQVLINLAVNAREAMPGGGILTIETHNVPERKEVLLEIRDTGKGMDESTRRHLFEPFFTTKQGSRNTGLGLAIVFGIVSHGGGRIEVSSQPDEGAVFRIYMPRIQSPAAAGPEPAASASGHRGSGTVLVVEDREEVRRLTCQMLEQLGYETLPAASGAEALAIAACQPDPIPLLLTDVVIPGMNGLEVADRVQRLYPQIRVVFMSGYTDRILAHDGALDSSAAYLQKPFTLSELAAALRKVEQTPQ
jgi:PAS domain S-box-containing protein